MKWILRMIATLLALTLILLVIGAWLTPSAMGRAFFSIQAAVCVWIISKFIMKHKEEF